MNAVLEKTSSEIESPYKYQRLQLTSSEDEVHWRENVWPQLWQMQQETFPLDEQRHHYEQLTHSLQSSKTVAVAMKDASENIVGFSYVVPNRALRRGMPFLDRRVGHHMMVIVDPAHRNNGLVYSLMEEQFREATASGQYDYVVGEYNANTGIMTDGNWVEHGFASHVKKHPWKSAEITSMNPLISPLYGRQERMTFKLKR